MTTEKKVKQLQRRMGERDYEPEQDYEQNNDFRTVCAMHDHLVGLLEAQQREHKSDILQMTPWKVTALIVVAGLTMLGAMMGFTYFNLNQANKNFEMIGIAVDKSINALSSQIQKIEAERAKAVTERITQGLRQDALVKSLDKVMGVQGQVVVKLDSAILKIMDFEKTIEKNALILEDIRRSHPDIK